MSEKKVKALVLAGFGINCDFETEYVFKLAGAEARRVHVNRLIELGDSPEGLSGAHILALDGGFAWADDHGAGVLLSLKLKAHLGRQLEEFIKAGKLVMGICNGFQALVNIGLLPGFDGDYRSRQVALAANECGNFRNEWVQMLVNGYSPCVFTKGLTRLDAPVRHGEGKFYAPAETLSRLAESNQIVMKYAKPARPGQKRTAPHLWGGGDLVPAGGSFPHNPNGSLDDIAGVCDQTGRIFGLMPHPEAYHSLINHPDWTRIVDAKKRKGFEVKDWDGQGLKVFQNAVNFVKDNLL